MIKKSELRKIILNELLREQTEDDLRDDDISPGLDFGSIDQQVDAFILKFEKDSIENAGTSGLGESLATLSLAALLTEQDAPTNADAEVEEESEEESTEDEVETDEPTPKSDGDLKDVSAAVTAPVLPLNIDEFTRRVARLAMNYHNLIDIQGAIVERALQFLKENYNLEHANQMIDLLDTQFDFDIGSKAEVPEGPYAVGAIPGGGGGGGTV